MIDDSDPLDEREDAEKEVRTKRLLETMDEDTELAKLRKLLDDEDARDFLWRVMGWCGIFEDPMHTNFGQVAYGLGKAKIGKMLLVEINLANPQAWLSMQLKAAARALEIATAERTKRLRKGRST